MDWAEFAAALGAFLASHVIPARFRGALVGRFGMRAYVLGYSVLSLGLLYWLIVAAGRAPFVELWPQAGWQRWLANLAMPGAVLLAATGGMAGLMAGFAIWAGVHLLANGDLSYAIMFGLMLAYALFGLIRAPRAGVQLGWRRLGVALLVWAVLLQLHPLVIGVSPLP